jgi:Flp pilus assembly protein TadD
MHPSRCGITVALCLLASGCATHPVEPVSSLDVPAFRGARQTDDSDLPGPAEFLAVDDEMRAYARDVLATIDSPRERVRRLAADLIEPGGPRSVRYDEGRTLTAREVFHLRQANCLSFTALAVLLARVSGLEANFQDVPVLPQWHVAGGTFVVERHVDALIPFGTIDAVIDFRPPHAATYTTAHIITDANATAQYFGNLGVDRFTAGDLEGAYRLYRRGLQVDPRASALWLNLGVVLARNGQWQDAERVYRTALAISPGDLSALNNLAVTLEQLGDEEGAARLHARVERYRLQNPYYLYWLGEQALQLGDASAATEWFAAAVGRMPEEADFHFALARSQLAAGRTADAERSLANALRWAQTDTIRARYREQFESLRQPAAPGSPAIRDPSPPSSRSDH